jgi:aminoglycoside 6'-N-acetyltransferase
MQVDTAFEPLVTERLVLRRSTPEDAAEISAYRRDPEVQRFQGWDRTDALAIRQEIERMLRRSPGEPGGWVQLSVEERETGRLIGDVGISPAEAEPGVMKVGYTIAPAYQGRGYGTEAVRALVDYALDTLGADVVRMYADADNIASIRLAEKAGMTLVERIEHRSRLGSWDGVRYEVTRASRPTP